MLHTLVHAYYSLGYIGLFCIIAKLLLSAHLPDQNLESLWSYIMDSESLSPSALFNRSLDYASKALNLPAIEDHTQELLTQSLNDLESLRHQISDLSLFSPNEVFEDISTRDIIYLFVPYVFSEVQSRLRSIGRAARMNTVVQTEGYLRSFISLVENYEIIPEDERSLYSSKTTTVIDPAKRRDLKISQYKKEKDLRAGIEVIRKRGGQPSSDSPSSNFDLIASLLPKASKRVSDSDEQPLDSETDDVLRKTTCLLLRLTFVEAQKQLESLQQELEILRNAPPSPQLPSFSDLDGRDRQRESDGDLWKLDSPLVTSGKGPLLDSSGKPLRTFTILPSGAGERSRLQAQVFGPGHRLPTMSIDEYLEVERQRGNIITGGGAASRAAPTSSEKLAIDSEMDGTAGGETRAEEKRLKDESWARYVDEHPRGAGNTMNRG